jgi:saccharopine dehydrogenase-like NADP-dependent oxidoreductase
VAASQRICVYGATGHTGRLVATQLSARGYGDMILAGRDADALTMVADRIGPAARVQAAQVDDPASLEQLLSNDVFAVINCAGPFADSGMPLASAAVESGVHYLDHAAEPMHVRALFDTLQPAAVAQNVMVLPGMSFYGAVADMLADLVTDGRPEAGKVTVAYAVSGWRMTAASRDTALRLAGAQRLVLANGALQVVDGSKTTADYQFPAPIGRRPVLTAYPAGEVVTIPRHVATQAVEAVMTAATFQDEAVFTSHDIDASQRAGSEFTVVVEAEYGTETRRGHVTGSDIYGVGAHVAVEAVTRLATSTNDVLGGVLSASEAFDAKDFLASIHELTVHPSR